jgi:transcription elongation factor GreA
MAKSYLTQQGFERFQEELEHLRTIRRKEVAERLREAMADGDAGIDADAECEAARNEQAFVEGRIRELECILANAHVIDETESMDIIQVGAKVTIQEDGTDPEVYTIVGAAEARPLNGRISNESPLGRALLGHSTGDEVSVQAPNGAFTVRILKIG